MALRNQPYLPLYVNDVLTDEKLNECSASTQGIFFKLICLMHKSERYGTIVIEQKAKKLDEQLKNFVDKITKQLLFNDEEIYKSLQELVKFSVLKISADGTALIQKRMVKDNQISIKRANAGRKGGIAKQSSAMAKSVANGQAKHQANTVYESDNAYESDNTSNNVLIGYKDLKDLNGLDREREDLDFQQSLNN